MNQSKQIQDSDFRVEGQFLGFIVEDGYKLKSLKLSTAQGVYWIKLSKVLRRSLQAKDFQVNDKIIVTGSSKLDVKTGKLKLKADSVATQGQESQILRPTKKAKAKILVCQESSCCKRGAKQVVEALKQTLHDRDLSEHVQIVKTGCMKHCKAGPHLVFMPSSSHYSQINPTEAAAIVDKHFIRCQEPCKPASNILDDRLRPDAIPSSV
jgi:(2Fe-2S) ferredoxin